MTKKLGDKILDILKGLSIDFYDYQWYGREVRIEDVRDIIMEEINNENNRLGVGNLGYLIRGKL